MNGITVLACLAVLLVQTAVCKYSFDEFHKFFRMLHCITQHFLSHVIRITKLLKKDVLEESSLEKTRMNSCTMRTVHCSGRHGGGWGVIQGCVCVVGGWGVQGVCV